MVQIEEEDVVMGAVVVTVVEVAVGVEGTFGEEVEAITEEVVVAEAITEAEGEGGTLEAEVEEEEGKS